MKMVYERPVMRAELYAANQYVAVCDTWRDNPNQLIVNESSGNWYSNYYNHDNGNGKDTKWSADYDVGAGVKFDMTGVDTSHIFTAKPTVDEYYVTCSCGDEYGGTYAAHEGTYYLERSYFWCTDGSNNEEEIFFLYKENTGNNELNICDGQGWPRVESGKDAAIAMVGYDFGKEKVPIS